jgi:uncharacterized protein (UPF0303 family)
MLHKGREACKNEHQQTGSIEAPRNIFKAYAAVGGSFVPSRRQISTIAALLTAASGLQIERQHKLLLQFEAVRSLVMLLPLSR